MTTALKAMAIRNASAVAAGHTFVVVMRDGYPINVLGRIKDVPEVCGIFCATANPVQVVVAENEAGRGVLGRDRRRAAKGRGDGRGRRETARLPANDRVQEVGAAVARPSLFAGQLGADAVGKLVGVGEKLADLPHLVVGQASP